MNQIKKILEKSELPGQHYFNKFWDVYLAVRLVLLIPWKWRQINVAISQFQLEKGESARLCGNWRIVPSTSDQSGKALGWAAGCPASSSPVWKMKADLTFPQCSPKASVRQLQAQGNMNIYMFLYIFFICILLIKAHNIHKN